MDSKILYLPISDYLTTPDLNLTACLICLGFSLEAIDKSKDQKLFVIKKKEGLDEIIKEYFAHNLFIDPLLFAHTVKDLKTRLYHVQS